MGLHLANSPSTVVSASWGWFVRNHSSVECVVDQRLFSLQLMLSFLISRNKALDFGKGQMRICFRELGIMLIKNEILSYNHIYDLILI